MKSSTSNSISLSSAPTTASCVKCSLHMGVSTSFWDTIDFELEGNGDVLIGKRRATIGITRVKRKQRFASAERSTGADAARRP